jgi:hypothetical protein
MTPESLIPWFAWLAPRLLLLFGLGFLVANLRLGAALWAYRRRVRSALLVWEAAKPRFYGFSLALGVILGVLLLVEVVGLRRSPPSIFGEAMMFLYYGYTFPLSTRIRRGFYGEGVWSDSGFMRWSEISAVSWKEEPTLTLVLVSHARSLARHLQIPGNLYGQARRLLQDRIRAHDIRIGGAGLDLGSREGTDTV